MTTVLFQTVQVSSRAASTVEREFTSDVVVDVSATPGSVKESTTVYDDVTTEPSCSDVDVSKRTNKAESADKIPSKSSSSNLFKDVQSTENLAGSYVSQSSESVYSDARSNTSDVEDYASCNDDEENVQVLESSHQCCITIPISSSLVDTLSGVNRLIDVVRHFLHLLCPKKTSTRYDPLRMSPDDRNEIHEQLEQGRVDMVRMLGDVCNQLCVNNTNKFSIAKC